VPPKSRLPEKSARRVLRSSLRRSLLCTLRWLRVGWKAKTQEKGVGSVERVVGDVNIEAIRGDITSQDNVDAIVNAANAELKSGGGVAGAIHRAAGPGLYEEAHPLAPIDPGEAVITGGHNLPNRYVIHVLGPVYGSDKPEAELLANCYRNALALAEENAVSSVAFPAISTGVFGYPLEAATEVALRTVIETAEGLEHVRLIRFVLFGEDDLEVYESALTRLL
jgi:O-acetyl-ADP-ribose deacetylase (regulator of RNase III)